MKRLVILILFATPLLLLAQGKVKDTVRVFYLGGQSNMNGYGYVDQLPDSLNQTFDDIFIYQGSTAGDNTPSGGAGLWSPLKPGHGTGFSSDGNNNKYSNRFGPELGFAARLRQLYPGEKIAIIKYAKEGSSIDTTGNRTYGTWDPDYEKNDGINQYDFFLKTVNGAFADTDMDGNGKEEYLKPSGIIWMQGESDAGSEDVGNAYYNNLKRLMDMLRASFRVDDLPVVIGKISDSNNDADGKVWDHGELVQYAQETYARNDKNAAIVRATKKYEYSDKYHYDSAGFIDLGVQFADAVYALTQEE